MPRCDHFTSAPAVISPATHDMPASNITGVGDSPNTSRPVGDLAHAGRLCTARQLSPQGNTPRQTEQADGWLFRRQHNPLQGLSQSEAHIHTDEHGRLRKYTSSTPVDTATPPSHVSPAATRGTDAKMVSTECATSACAVSPDVWASANSQLSSRKRGGPAELGQSAIHTQTLAKVSKRATTMLAAAQGHSSHSHAQQTRSCEFRETGGWDLQRFQQNQSYACTKCGLTGDSNQEHPGQHLIKQHRNRRGPEETRHCHNCARKRNHDAQGKKRVVRKHQYPAIDNADNATTQCDMEADCAPSVFACTSCGTTGEPGQQNPAAHLIKKHQKSLPRASRHCHNCHDRLHRASQAMQGQQQRVASQKMQTLTAVLNTDQHNDSDSTVDTWDCMYTGPPMGNETQSSGHSEDDDRTAVQADGSGRLEDTSSDSEQCCYYQNTPFCCKEGPLDVKAADTAS